MRATASRLAGEMPGGKHYMGWWGDMGGPKQKGIIQYTQSPFRQKAMKGALQGYLFYGYKRAAHQAPYILLPFGFAYGVYVWAKGYDEWQNSKAGHLALAEKSGSH